MENFYKSLKKYYYKYLKVPINDRPQFEFEETTSISPEIALSIFYLFKELDNLEKLIDKEEDYNRLLRQENQNLTEELDSIYEGYYENDDDEKDIDDTPKIQFEFNSNGNENLIS